MKYNLSPHTTTPRSEARRRARFSREAMYDAFGRRAPHPSTDTFIDRLPHVSPPTIYDVGKRGR